MTFVTFCVKTKSKGRLLGWLDNISLCQVPDAYAIFVPSGTLAAPLTYNGTNLSFSSASSGTGVKVVLNTVPGEVYDVSFDYDAIVNVTSAGVYANTTLLQTLTGDGNVNLSFTATATSTEFKLLLTGTGIRNASIDDLLIKHDVQYSLSDGGYRFGFNVPIAIGKEKVDELYGDGNAYAFEYRIHDPRIGRFLSVDPLYMDYSSNSSYIFAENNVIRGRELEGLENDLWYAFAKYWIGEAELKNTHAGQVLFRTLQHTSMIGQTDMVKDAVVSIAQTETEEIKNNPAGYVVKKAFDPLNTVQGTVNTVTGVVNTVDQAINNNNGEAQVDLAVMAVGFVYGGMSFKAKAYKHKVDLMDGQQSKYPGWINFDMEAISGIQDWVSNFGKYFKKGSISEIVVNNPQAEFLPYVGESLEQGGTITIRGQMSNKYFNSIYKAKTIEGYKIISRQEGLPKAGYKKSDGTPLNGGEYSIYEIVLKRL